MMSGTRAVKKLGLLLKTHTKFPVVSVLKMQGTISAQRGMMMIQTCPQCPGVIPSCDQDAT